MTHRGSGDHAGRIDRAVRRVAYGAALMVLCALPWGGGAAGSNGLESPPPKVGEKAPEFRLNDVDGRTHRLAEYSGRIVVLLWLNRRCPVCERILESRLPHKAMQVAKMTPTDERVVFLAINSTYDTTADENRGMRDQFELRIPILLDPRGEAARAFDARMTPQVFVIDRKGNLAYIGAFDDDPNGAKAEKGEKVTNYIVNTVELLAADRPVRPAQTRPYGCRIRFAE